MADLSSAEVFQYELSLGDKLLKGPLTTTTGRIQLSDCGTRLTKSVVQEMPEFWRSIQKKHIQREIDTYRHLPRNHPRLVDLVHFDNTSLTIEYMPNGSLATYLERNEATVTVDQCTKWIRQTAEGVALLHAHNVIHADLKPTNLLLDGTLDVRVADFGGCSLLGQPPYTLESGPFYQPAKWRETDKLSCSVVTDLFALGSCIFHIATGKPPYNGMDDRDVETKFANKEYPPLDGVLFADVVKRCWQSEFESAEAVIRALGS